MAAGSATVTVRVVLDEDQLVRLRAHRSAALEESIELVAHILGKEPSQVPIARALQVAEFIAAGGDYDTEAAMATVEPVEVPDEGLDAPVWVNDGPCACRKCEEPTQRPLEAGDVVQVPGDVGPWRVVAYLDQGFWLLKCLDHDGAHVKAKHASYLERL